jgi:NAD(P)-dependent dehydrogenase (short-subunit alcohol dehydrogenase family)
MAVQENNKVVLITGANKGIGFESARRLGLNGFTVLVGARDKEKGTTAEAKLRSAGVNAIFIQIDVTSQKSIDAAAQKIDEQYGRLDVLVNNAGGAIGKLEEIVLPSTTPLEALKSTFDANFFGLFSVTKAMLPLLHKSDAGRIVNMSSGLGSLTLQSDPSHEHYAHKILVYNSSKTAVNALTVHFNYELKQKGSNIKINSADPGFTATDLNGFTGTRTVEQAANVVVELATLPDDGPTGGFFDENGLLPW